MNLNSAKNDYFENCLQEVSSSDRALQMQQYVQHGNTSTYMHCQRVAYYSYKISQIFHLKVNIKSLIRGAFLHDFYLYDWHESSEDHRLHGFSHPAVALKNAQEDFCLDEIEKNIISSHMWPLTLTKLPLCMEAVLVCIADKLCSVGEIFRSPAQ